MYIRSPVVNGLAVLGLLAGNAQSAPDACKSKSVDPVQIKQELKLVVDQPKPSENDIKAVVNKVVEPTCGQAGQNNLPSPCQEIKKCQLTFFAKCVNSKGGETGCPEAKNELLKVFNNLLQNKGAKIQVKGKPYTIRNKEFLAGSPNVDKPNTVKESLSTSQSGMESSGEDKALRKEDKTDKKEDKTDKKEDKTDKKEDKTDKKEVKAPTKTGSVNSAKNNPPFDSPRIIVYWGQDAAVSLKDVCNDDAYSVVDLAFLNELSTGGKDSWPMLNLAGLTKASQPQQDAGAKGLKDGSSLINDLKACQKNKKLVMLSLGGAEGYSNINLTDGAHGERVADNIWNLFLGGKEHSKLRPFGPDVILDGIDFDPEAQKGHIAKGHVELITRLKKHFAEDTSKKYYLSAAPECPFGRYRNFEKYFGMFDWLQPQYYNNPGCQLGNATVGGTGTRDQTKAFSDALGPGKIFFGIPATDKSIKGHIAPENFKREFSGVVEKLVQDGTLKLEHFGGAMLWDAGKAHKNKDYQKTVQKELKELAAKLKAN